ncbi:MAG TPA: redoxin domain-containing protein [Planctomycetaceae bacterium]|nr:redoxin domain-containing protein [Planctomycetaceae bacterium]
MYSFRSRSKLLFASVVALVWCLEARADKLHNPVQVQSEKGVCDVELDVVVRTQPFPAAGTDAGNHAIYKLRSPVYVLRKANGRCVDGDANSLVGPTLRVKRGDLLRVRINNRLDPNQLPPDKPHAPENWPQEFYITNLHTHGLHVSPAGKADNVYVSILPGEHHQYEYRIPNNQSPGTFFYHPHRHGSVALQLASGMAGAIIVEGDESALSKGPEKPRERIFVLQQIHGSQTGNDNVLSILPSDIYDKIKEDTASAQTGKALKSNTYQSWRTLKGLLNRQRAARAPKQKLGAKGTPSPTNCCTPENCTAVSTDPASNTEWLLVNGQNTQGRTITMQPGEVQRWRFIHAGIDEVINLAIAQYDSDGNIQACVPFYEVAVDGIPRGRLVKEYHRDLYPAYRSDVVFQAPKDPLPPGMNLGIYSYCAPKEATLNGSTTNFQQIATIVLGKNPKQMDLPDDASLSPSVPLQFRSAISDREVANRHWSLFLDFPKADPPHFLINGKEYGMDRIDRHVRLDTAEEWSLKSGGGPNNHAGHPFHIHVNPFLHFQYGTARAVQGLLAGIPIRPDTLLTQLGYQTTDTVTISGTLPSGTKFSCDTPGSATLGVLSKNICDALNKQVADGYRMDFVQNRLILRDFLSKLEGLVINQTSPTSPQMTFADPARQVVDLIWRDTLMAPSCGPPEIIRMRFRDFPGDTVLHCHIVDHEDQGMMKNVRIHPAEDPQPEPDKNERKEPGVSAPTAPDFSLADAAGKVHRLAELVGRPSVLIFFRGRACPQCNLQLKSFARFRDRFASLGVNLVAVSSTDRAGLLTAGSPPTDEQPLPFLLLGDPTRQAFDRYGCVDASDSPLHGTFVLDRRGLVRWSDVAMEPYMDVERVLAEVKRLGS